MIAVMSCICGCLFLEDAEKLGPSLLTFLDFLSTSTKRINSAKETVSHPIADMGIDEVAQGYVDVEPTSRFLKVLQALPIHIKDPAKSTIIRVLFKFSICKSEIFSYMENQMAVGCRLPTKRAEELLVRRGPFYFFRIVRKLASVI